MATSNSTRIYTCLTDVTLETVGFQHHANVKTRLFRVDQIEHINVRVRWK